MLRFIFFAVIYFSSHPVLTAQFKIFQRDQSNKIAFSEENNSSLSEGFVMELSNIQLQQLIDSAILNSPFLKNTKIDKQIAAEELAGTKKNVLSMLSLLGGYNYGNVGNFTAVETTQNTSSAISNVVTSTYTFGVGLKIPLDKVVNRKHEVRIAQLNFNKLTNDYDQALRDLRLIVIEKFSNLKLIQRILYLKEKNLKSAFVNLKMAERMFEGGEVDISDLSSVTDLYTKAEIDLEQSKSDYQMAYYHLEQIVGVKLIGFLKK